MSNDMKVWKFPLPWADTFELALPAKARVLSVQPHDTPGSEIALWALVDPEAPVETRRFALVGTGLTVSAGNDEELDHIGTVQLAGGSLVFHVFERLP